MTKRFDAPSWAISLAEKLPNNPWESFDANDVISPDGNSSWLDAEADPEASRLFWIKRKAVILAAASIAVWDVWEKNYDGLPAAAYLYREQGHIRTIPHGFGTLPRHEDEQLLEGVAMGEGLNDFSLVMGIWMPKERTLVVPHDLQVVDRHVDIKTELPLKYPRVPHI